jgi:hypothetical protein
VEDKRTLALAEDRGLDADGKGCTCCVS